MATRLRVSRASVGRWLNGHSEPKYAALLAWASITGVDLHWLETGEGEPTSGDPDGGSQLPRLDSNQQPSVYRSVQVRGPRVTDTLTSAVRRRPPTRHLRAVN